MKSLVGGSLVLAGLFSMAVWADEPAPAKSLFDRLDANGDGQVTPEEAAGDNERHFKRLLRTADDNGDGKLSRSEFAANLQPPPVAQPKPADPPAAGADRDGIDRGEFFKRLDLNGDGQVRADEHPEARRGFLSRLIERADKNNDGALSLEEFRSSTPGVDSDRPVRPNPPRAAQPGNSQAGNSEPGGDSFFKRLDLNGDGKIRADEHPEARRGFLSRLIERADKNNDGAVDQAEFLAANPERTDKLPTNDTDRPRPNQPRNQGQPRPGDQRPQPGAARPSDRPAGPGGPGGLLMALDRDRDGQLSADEIRDAAAALKQLDRNGDGTLSRDELGPRPAMDRRPGGPAAGERPAQPDNRPERRPGQEGNQPQRQRPEPQRPRPEGGQAGNQEAGVGRIVDRIFAADANGDGKLSRDEAPERMNDAIFNRLDANGDGSIDRDELKQGLANFAGRRPENRPRNSDD